MVSSSIYPGPRTHRREMKLFAFLLLSLSVANVYSSPEDELRTGNHQLSVKMYKEILKTRPNDNFVYSPFPVQTILASLASAGKNDQSTTVKEIRNVLGLPQNKADTESAFQKILSDMDKSSDDDFKLFDASKMYIKRGYTVQDWYKETAQRVYHTEIETINFADSYNTVNDINSWVSKKTNNKITNYIAQGDIDGSTTNVLINALFLMGKWMVPFDKAHNVWAKFYGLHQTTTNVDMMTNTDTYDYAEDTNAKYLKMELFRNGGGAEMVFVLPLKRDGLDQLENNVEQLIKDQPYNTAKVDVQLPKFTINTDLKMKPILQNLGIRKLFTNGLDLIGLRSPYHPLVQVSDVMQKSVIEVSEWGVTAAAAVETETKVDAAPVDLHKEFIADHPFLFYIVVDDIVLFAGRVVKP